MLKRLALEPVADCAVLAASTTRLIYRETRWRFSDSWQSSAPNHCRRSPPPWFECWMGGAMRASLAAVGWQWLRRPTPAPRRPATPRASSTRFPESAPPELQRWTPASPPAIGLPPSGENARTPAPLDSFLPPPDARSPSKSPQDTRGSPRRFPDAHVARALRRYPTPPPPARRFAYGTLRQGFILSTYFGGPGFRAFIRRNFSSA